MPTSVICLIGLVVTISTGDLNDTIVSPAIVLAPPVVLAAAWWARRWSAGLLVAGAAFVTVWTSLAVTLWPVAAALVFLSLVESRRAPPLLGGIGGLVGGAVAVIVLQGGLVAPVLAVAVGCGAAVLVRSRTRVSELTDEAEELRGQAAWLEQRTTVARELHDTIGHHVTAMVVQSEAGQLGDPQRALRTVGELGRTVLAELDALVVHLRDPDAPLTVSAPPRLLDIDELLAAPLRASGVAVDVTVAEGLVLSEPDVLTVYRVVQEALTNVTRHARATRAWVEVDRTGDLVRVRVGDDGVGPPARLARGSGLLGIEERVSARGGSVALERRPGGGSVLQATLQVAQGHEPERPGSRGAVP